MLHEISPLIYHAMLLCDLHPPNITRPAWQSSYGILQQSTVCIHLCTCKLLPMYASAGHKDITVPHELDGRQGHRGGRQAPL